MSRHTPFRRRDRALAALRLSMGMLVVLCCPTVIGARKPAFSELLNTALQTEQTGGAAAATEAYLALLEQAATAPPSAATTGERLAATLAALEALSSASYPTALPAGIEHALAFRTPGGVDKLMERLGSLYERAEGPLLRSEIADAVADLARYRGDAAAANRWEAAAGSVRAAAVVGPVAWPPLPALGQPLAMERPGAKLAARYPGTSPFAPTVALLPIAARTGFLPVGKTSLQDGVFVVVMDAEVPRAQTIGLSLTSPHAATVSIGGKVVLKRTAALGLGSVTRYALVRVDAGRVRVTLQVGKQGIGADLRLRLSGEDGRPLATRVPAVGEAASGRVRSLPSLEWPAPALGTPELLTIAAMLATRDARTAEHLLEHAELLGSTAPPAMLLLLARALAAAGDVPEFRRRDLQRTAYEKVLAAWPNAWEATVGRAQQIGAAREGMEGTVLALRELDAATSAAAPADPVVQAFVAAVSLEAGARDLALRALARAEQPLADTALYAQLRAWLSQQVGQDLVKARCQTPGLNRGSHGCLDALRGVGNFAEARAELERLRALHQTPLPNTSLNLLIASGDSAGALALYDSLLPAERPLGTLGLLLPAASPDSLQSRLYRDAPSAQDGTGALVELMGYHDEPDEDSGRLVAEDRPHPKMPDAAAAVLRHRERYELAESGVLSTRIYDLRRVAGTSEVDAGAPLALPVVEGLVTGRIVRRRIFKQDGRIIEADKSTVTRQRDTDLPQLERGDYVESIYQAFARPHSSGQLVLDSPDLLPERTSVGLATVELRVPAALSLATWSHPLLGQPELRRAGGSQIRIWTLREAGPRRIERQVPLMDRKVAISVGTLTWRNVGQALSQTIAEMDDEDPAVASWARAAARSAESPAAPPPAAELVGRIVDAIGKRVPFSVGMDDSGASSRWRPRVALDAGTGSRAWLLYSALKSLGLHPELVLAETQSFSSTANFPAHRQRFNHALVIVHLPASDLWVDPDVSGPPLPAGHVSVELRGRMALRPGGQIVPIAASFSDAGDEATIDLKLDEQGNATGTCSIALQGRSAQLLADLFPRLVGDQRKNALRTVVLGWLPYANVDEVNLQSKEGAWTVEVQARITIVGYAQREGDTWQLPGLDPVHAGYPWTSTGRLSARFAGQGGRQNALAISSALQYRAHRRVQLPSGWHAQPTPNLNYKDETIQASRSSRLTAQTLAEDFALSLPTGTISLQQYPSFVGTLRNIDDAFLATISAR